MPCPVACGSVCVGEVEGAGLFHQDTKKEAFIRIAKTFPIDFCFSVTGKTQIT